MKYYFRSIETGEKIFADTLAEINRLAKREANKFAQAVQVYTASTRKSHRQASYAKNPAKPYYVLFVRFDGQKWGPEFGDYDKETVQYERQDMIDGYQGVKSKDTKIVKFASIPSHAQSMAKAAELNGEFKSNPAASIKKPRLKLWVLRYYSLDESRYITETYATLAAVKRAAKIRERGGYADEITYYYVGPEKITKKFNSNPATGRHVEMWYDNRQNQYALEKMPGGGYRLEDDRQRPVKNFYGTLANARDWLRHSGYAKSRKAFQYERNPATPASKARKRAASKRGAVVVWRQEGREKRQPFANKGLATIEARKMKAAGYAGVRVIGA